GDVEARISEDLPMGVDDALALRASHRASTQWVHRDDPAEVASSGILSESSSEPSRDLITRVANPFEMGTGLLHLPIHVEIFLPALAVRFEKDPPVRDVASHRQQGHRAGR